MKSTLDKYCCFLHPMRDYAERSLSDLCPQCGRSYGFPLFDAPTQIGRYEVVQSLDRGFYSATYLAVTGKLRVRKVLKVSSKAVYEFFGKDMEQECQAHSQVAEDSDHVVQIEDYFDESVLFGDLELPCHVAVLEYVNGASLRIFLANSEPPTASAVCQVAIDLFRILDVFRSKGCHHNDLHGGNIFIRQLGATARRADAIDGSIKAVAIDLGSVADESLSYEEKRIGDTRRVAQHLQSMSELLLKHDPDSRRDLDNRLAYELSLLAQLLTGEPEYLRIPEAEEVIRNLRDAFHRVSSPWLVPLELRSFSDSYNSQSLAPWYISDLLVDPDDLWLKSISTRGPQIITGVRGCGKTMLLRALEFHARAASVGETMPGDPKAMEQLKCDNFVGLYVPSIRLLDPLDNVHRQVSRPLARLFVAFALQALRALDHLLEINKESVQPLAHQEIAEALAAYLATPKNPFRPSSITELRRYLSDVLIQINRGDLTFNLRGTASDAFHDLAGAIRRSATLWNDAHVLFLLDDVSTRYLKIDQIGEIFSELIFQSDICAFKFTSEVQTLELALQTPGQTERAWVGRDYKVFDLGAEVYRSVSDGLRGKKFIQNILQKRADHYSAHPPTSPEELLGDISLNAIAEHIAETREASAGKKGVYHGISALASVCVGDIGDVISLYELMLKKANGRNVVPIAPATQSDAYQEFCSRRLYDLNRRGGELKDFVMSFAGASYRLLIKSRRDYENRLTRRKRLRQYLSIYVRITKGDMKWQSEKLRDLVDAGVFVFSGGSSAPRTKTRDSDPIQQFKLTFRKIYGLSNFIGLADSDRFELSGEDLEKWLRKPSDADALMRNLGTNGFDEQSDDAAEDTGNVADDISADTSEHRLPPEAGQLLLFDRKTAWLEEAEPKSILDRGKLRIRKLPSVHQLDFDDVRAVKPDGIVIGLGFEERALASARALLSFPSLKTATLIRYPEKGMRDVIRGLVRDRGVAVNEVDYEDAVVHGFEIHGSRTVVDLTGLAKPIIFRAVRNSLRQSKQVFIARMRAATHYPRDNDLSKILKAESDRDNYALLDSLSDVLTGEEGPYDLVPLLESDADVTRRRMLCAFSSAKHERLLTLLDNRHYDRVEIVASSRTTPRGRVAELAAMIAVDNCQNQGADMVSMDSDNFAGVLAFLTEQYRTWYINSGFSFEFGLTGSKLQAAACASISAVFKVSQCWYVRPKCFDVARFTEGVGESDYYSVELR